MADLSIERDSRGWVDRYRSYKIVVNGDEVGSLKAGEEKVIGVDAGSAEVYLKIDWCRSRKILLDLDAESKVQLSCRPRTVLTAFYGVTFGRNDYIQIEAI